MNPEINKLRTLADNMGAKLLPVMENLTKKDVYLVVDTPKKAKKFIKAVDIFNETLDDLTRKEIKKFKAGWLHNEYEIPVVVFENDKWIGAWLKTSTDASEEISIKQLRTILAKEHLKEGDWIIAKCTSWSVDYLVKVVEIEERGILGLYSFYSEDNNIWGNLSVCTGLFSSFKRYATPEEIALLEPCEEKKELEVGKWYKWVDDEENVFIFNHQEKGKSYGWFKGLWCTSDWHTDSFIDEQDLIHMYPQEVEQALIEEAKILGHRYKKYVYISEENTLCGLNGWLEEVFVDGKWNEPDDKFAELKEAHKNGAVIQFRNSSTFGKWLDLGRGVSWNPNNEYRIKPKEKPTLVCKDIAVIEQLHDILLDNHKYDIHCNILTNARTLSNKLKSLINNQ